MENLSAGKNRVYFISKTMGGDIKLAGDLFLPPKFDSNKKYPTIVFTGPFNQVKEQMGAVYGEKMSEKGYVFLAFDHQGFGDSEGAIRNYEHTGNKISGLQDAISYLRMQSFVDREKLYGLGGCAGGNTMVYTAVADKRLKKIGLVSALLAHTVMTFVAGGKRKNIDEKFLSANEAYQRYYETGEVVPFDSLDMEKPETKNSKVRDVREGYDYYMTKRAGKETNPNYSHLGPEFFHMDWSRYSAARIGKFLSTPVMTIYGSKAGSKPLSWYFHWKVNSKSKKRVSIKGATHVDLYDVDKYVNQVVTKLDEFFKK
ncbi:alpha/beta hydrolase [Flammeovirga aprica]|uniref:Alpha/beta hydrolase n=1 Tax=Flammeovirga aprica JL-4 TaxID=694437 RepID=A0A7X9XDF1_9BACT|nr:alpha/beta hydrolase [Flammeovirga aprica]NME72584.1 alpha/beta hydrolase [Flammeovirga aprica JL-4]